MIDDHHATALTLGPGVHVLWPQGSSWSTDLVGNDPNPAIEAIRARGGIGAAEAVAVVCAGTVQGSDGALTLTIGACGRFRCTFQSISDEPIAVQRITSTIPLTIAQLIRAGLN